MSALTPTIDMCRGGGVSPLGLEVIVMGKCKARVQTLPTCSLPTGCDIENKIAKWITLVMEESSQVVVMFLAVPSIWTCPWGGSRRVESDVRVENNKFGRPEAKK